MVWQTITFEENGGVAVLTLNRPDRLNSFTTEMHEEVSEAMEIVEGKADLRAMLITGAGRGFCAGQDLSDRIMSTDDSPPDLGHTLGTYYNPLVRRLRRLPKPVIAAVNGVAAGAGANLALACDLVLAARSASFLQAFCKLGLVPDMGGTYHLPRVVGSARAAGLALLGDKIPAETAADWGMIWRVVEDDQLMSEAMALARHLATQPTKGLGMIKQALNASLANDLDTQLDLERDLQRSAGLTEDYREGVAAFMEKRSAAFKGR